MVQNHLLQLLCLVAMEPPTYVGRETVRDEKLKVLQALRPMTPEDVDRDTVRGAYEQGVVDGEVVTSYVEDLGHPSRTETFAALRVEVQNWRWAGVPFYLRTGKRMDRRASEIVVVFKAPPHSMFPGSEGATESNRLHIRVQPDEGMHLHMTVKEPGPGGIRLRPVSLDLSYDDRVRRGLARRLRAAAPRRHQRATRPCSCAATRSRRRGRGSSRSCGGGSPPRAAPSATRPAPAGRPPPPRSSSGTAGPGRRTTSEPSSTPSSRM